MLLSSFSFSLARDTSSCFISLILSDSLYFSAFKSSLCTANASAVFIKAFLCTSGSEASSPNVFASCTSSSVTISSSPKVSNNLLRLSVSLSAFAASVSYRLISLSRRAICLSISESEPLTSPKSVLLRAAFTLSKAAFTLSPDKVYSFSSSFFLSSKNAALFAESFSSSKSFIYV